MKACFTETPLCPIQRFFPTFQRPIKVEPAKSKRGGARPGAGRKPQKPADDGSDLLGESTGEDQTTIGVVSEDATPLDFLKASYRNPLAPDGIRLRAAIAAAQYCHKKMADGGIKDAAKAAAKEAVGGKYAPTAPPLKVVGGTRK